MKHFLGLFFAWLLFVTNISLSYASEFKENDTVLYQVGETGITHVVHNVKITNLSAEYYTNKYNFGVGSQKITNLKSYDKSKSIKSELKQDATSSAIELFFSDQIVGKNTSRSFSIEYDTHSITQKMGSSWNISIPKVSSNDLESYLVTVSVPASFGPATTIFPQPEKIEQRSDQTFYNFTTQQMVNSGVSMNFGQNQVYTMGLTYHLNNSERNTVYTEIALPMNTPYQTIVYDSIIPKPQAVSVDNDGNYIAKYTLKPKESIQVQVIAKAIVFSKSTYVEPLSSQQKILLTQKQTYWETDDERIASLAATLKTPEKIYDFVVSNLTYNESKTVSNFDRLGAKKVIRSPDNSVCMEFTDLFIAIARAAGIPAREINGYAYTNDTRLRPASLSQDTLHAWPEYYDTERGWIAVDPTWENTTGGVDYFTSLDLNHIAFVRKGTSSETPYPAGAYKGENLNTRDIVVNFITETPVINNEIDQKISLSESHLAGTPLSWNINLTNTGNTGYIGTIREETKYKDNITSEEIPVNIPPFGTITIERKGIETNLTDNSHLLVVSTVGTSTTTKESQIVPFYKHKVTLIGLIYLVGVPSIAIFSYKVLHKKSRT